MIVCASRTFICSALAMKSHAYRTIVALHTVAIVCLGLLSFAWKSDLAEQQTTETTTALANLNLLEEEMVVLSDMRVSKRGDVAHLYWMTEMEFDNDFFTIESSEDGQSYEPVAFVQGAGTSEEPREYQVTDEVSSPEAIFYRLLQTGYDGSSTVLREMKVK